MSQENSYFSQVAGPPRPLEIDHLFGGSQAGYSYTSGSSTSELLQQLMDQVNDQSSILNELVGTLSGKSTGSALDTVLGGTTFGGSALGGIASAAQSGFSWQSVLSDIFPVGGLISGIASLFDSAPTPPPLNEYAAPPSLNFNAVLNSNGTLSQGSTNQYGYTESDSQGLDLTDAEGGPYSPYTRAPNGSLVPVAGDPTTSYSGTLNLPEFSQPPAASTTWGLGPSASQTTAAGSSSLLPILGANGGDATTAAGGPSISQLLQTVVAGSSTNAPLGSTASSTPSTSPTSSGASSTGGVASSTNNDSSTDGSNALPSFDQQWFNDHGSLIATAVRAELLNYHPIVDTINDL